MFKLVLVLASLTASPLAFAAFPDCTQSIPVSGYVLSEAVVSDGTSCAVTSYEAYDRAQAKLLATCVSIGGHYRARNQRAVCANDQLALPYKVSQDSGAQGSIYIEGVCTVDGTTGCTEQRAPTYWGVFYEN